ncbi:MAG TPA: alpha/beta hydrolase [Candidatus Saccharimonadales bacterium]|nr:alpha/beta hydrolase [Candidatus Saccharimonadales bacterium]
MKAQSSFLARHKRFVIWVTSITGALVVLAIAVYIAFQVSPWPNALVIRYFFDKGGTKMAASMEKYVPAGIVSVKNQQYRERDKDAKLDVFYPQQVANTSTALPTIVWVHGGAWISGNKEAVDPYLQILAGQNYTTVGIDYTIAPNAKYPTPVVQTTAALRYLQQNAKRLHIDPNNITLAGDSAGSQIAAQVATIITNPSYAHSIGISAPLAASQLKATILNCGAYDLTLPNYNGEDGKFLKTVLWAYSGSKDFLSDATIKQASVADYVTKDFPPSFITAGNADPLEAQSKEFAAVLTKLGVATDTLFYTESHQPRLPHEYQFDLTTADGQNALKRIENFLAATIH